MSTELTMLNWTAAATVLMWVPYIVTWLATHGIIPSLTYQTDHLPLAPWAERAKLAHYNAVENLVVFGALVIVAHLTGVANDATAAAAVTYFWARMAHYFVYSAGIPFGRTLTFAVGWAACLCIFYQIVSAAG